MEGSDKRATLSDRLFSLFSADPQPSYNHKANLQPASEPTSRRRSLDEDASSMRIARTRPPSPKRFNSHLPHTTTNQTRPTHTPKSLSMNLSLPSSSSSSRRGGTGKTQVQQRDSSLKPTLPAIRWLSGQSSGTNARHNTPTKSNPGTPLTQTPSEYFHPQQGPPSPSVYSEIADALDDDPNLLEVRSHLPSRPQAARLPNQFHSRPPNLLYNVARQTLPTAGLSPPPIYTSRYTDPFDDPFSSSSGEHNPILDLLYSPTPVPLPMPHSPAPAHLTRSPPRLATSPTRTSIDSLRSIQERGVRNVHTTPPTQRLSLPNPFQGWFASEDSKENMDPVLNEADKADTVEAQRMKLQQHYATPINPVVFCHGLLGFDTVTVGPSIAPVQFSHWRGITDALQANGVEVLITRVPATSSPVDRAKVLEEKISAVYPGRSVHLIGHSMGGIDARYLTTHLKQRTFKILSVTTVSSPHRGSSFADHFLQTIGHERMSSVVSLLDMLPIGGGDGKAFESLTIENMKKFNEETPDDPDVKYFSWGAAYDPSLLDTWKWPHSVVLEKEGPNDGLVSLKSAKWGTYLGTLEDVNHTDLVGWVNTARYKWAEIMGREIKFKPATFYLGITDYLARVVEGQETRQSLESEDGIEEGLERVGSAERKERKVIRQEEERAEMAESLAKGGEERESRRDPEEGKKAGPSIPNGSSAPSHPS